MPAQFEACIQQGGKVRTVNLSGGKYMHICYLGTKSFPGEVKMKKSKTTSKKSGFDQTMKAKGYKPSQIAKLKKNTPKV